MGKHGVGFAVKSLDATQAGRKPRARLRVIMSHSCSRLRCPLWPKAEGWCSLGGKHTHTATAAAGQARRDDVAGDMGTSSLSNCAGGGIKFSRGLHDVRHLPGREPVIQMKCFHY